MTSAETCCPFCNARLEPLPAEKLPYETAINANVPSPPLQLSTTKFPCPRCGELVPMHYWPVMSGSTLLPPVSAGPCLDRSKRRTLQALLGIMACMAGLALCYALYTADDRKLRHPKPRELPAPQFVRSPAELSALGYLPPDASLVAGVQVAALLQEPVGKTLLREPYPPLVDRAVRLLEKLGLTLEDLDHAVAALVDGATMPALICVVRTRGPYDLEKLAVAVKTAKSSVHEKRPLYEFTLEPIGEALLWSADEQTLIFAARLTQPAVGAAEKAPAALLTSIPTRAQPFEEHLSPALKGLFQERLAKQSQLWAVADLANKSALGKLTWLLPPGPLWSSAEPVKRFAVGVFPQEGMTLLASVFMGEAKAAGELKKRLQEIDLPKGVTLRAEGPPPGEILAEAQWVTVQVRASAEGIREALGRFRPR
jgi:hypothetical protein